MDSRVRGNDGFRAGMTGFGRVDDDWVQSLVLPRVENDNACVGEIANIASHQLTFVRMGRGSNDRIEGGHGFTFCFGLHRHLRPDLRGILVKRQDSIFETDLQLLEP